MEARIQLRYKRPGVCLKPSLHVQGPFQGKVRITFVDGGTLSNFPIGHFHTRGVPLLPTFGVRLSTDRNNYSDTSSLIQMFHAMNDASRQANFIPPCPNLLVIGSKPHEYWNGLVLSSVMRIGAALSVQGKAREASLILWSNVPWKNPGVKELATRSVLY